ncbi:MAG: CHAD domain-containing protein [Solirubrobacterales bacterium]
MSFPADSPSRSYRLKGEEESAAGVRRIATGRAEKATEELRDTDADFAGSIHGARKDLKKLRSVLRLVREDLGEDLFRTENRRYRDAGRLLSGSRDAEVKLQTVLELRRHFQADFPYGASGPWTRTLERERDRASGATGSGPGPQVERARAAIEEGRELIADWPLGADSWRLVRPGLARSYREGRRALRRTLADPSAENVHRWRKRAKDLWYQLLVLHDAWPDVLGATADQAHELTDLLGDHHDLAVLREDLTGRDAIDEREAFETLIERRQAELLAAAVEIGARLYAEKPKAFNRRMRACWDAWRGE